MKFEAFSFTYNGAVRKLTPRLQGKVFHITSPENFVYICKSGKILNNKDGVLTQNWNNNNYFANKGCVSVCDLVNNTKPRVTRRKYLSDYQIFGQGWGATTVFLFLSPLVHHKLITWQSWKREKAYGLQIVPELESGFPEAILLDFIEEVWILTINDREWLWN